MRPAVGRVAHSDARQDMFHLFFNWVQKENEDEGYFLRSCWPSGILQFCLRTKTKGLKIFVTSKCSFSTSFISNARLNRKFVNTLEVQLLKLLELHGENRRQTWNQWSKLAQKKLKYPVYQAQSSFFLSWSNSHFCRAIWNITKLRYFRLKLFASETISASSAGSKCKI